MNKTPIVSIVMPTYNVESYLPAAIESVLRQTFCDWELLVVDDGSTDKSNEIAVGFAEDDERIKVLSKENGGLSDARNYGLECANGKYVHFFDSDDLIQPDFYEKMVAAIEQDYSDIVVCGYYKDFEQEDDTIKSSKVACKEFVFPPPENINAFVFFTQIFNYAWNKLFKISFLQVNKLRYENGLSIIEDKEFMSRVIGYNPAIKTINYLGYRYQVRNRSTLGNSYSDKLVQCHLRGIVLQHKIFDKFYKDNLVLKQDKGHITFVTVKWIFHCIYNYSNLSAKEKRRIISQLIKNKIVSYHIRFYHPKNFIDKVLKIFIIKNNTRLISFIYNKK
mgnify:CR=1 FL=1